MRAKINIYYFENSLAFLCAQLYNKCAHRKRGDEMPERKGRPPASNPKSERLFIRVTPDEKKQIKDFMKSKNCSMLELLKKGMEVWNK